jgi:AcrR family transcriptional regulator
VFYTRTAFASRTLFDFGTVFDREEVEMSEERTFRAGPIRIRVTTGGNPAGPPKERLTTDRIVDEGASMRAIAKALDTGPASLYAHVANREELDNLVLDRIASKLTIPEPDPERWAEQLKDLMREMLELYRAHPGSARAAMAIIPTGTGAIRATDGILAICLAGGISPQAAAWFCDLAPQYVGAVAIEESIWIARTNSTAAGELPDHEEIDEQLTAYFQSLPPDLYPLVSSMATVLTNGDGNDRFEFGLDVILAGLAAVSEKYA